MKKLLKYLRNTIIVIVVLVIALVIYVMNSPTLFVWYLKNSSVFNGEVSKPANIAEYLAETTFLKDITYDSFLESKNKLDITYPTHNSEALPVIFWAHGGGFVAGDKEGTYPWGSMVSSKGYVFVSINYELADQSHYPNQIKQVADAVEYILAHADKFPMMDTKRLVFGGDSAGAHIMSQFVASQTNQILANNISVKQVVNPDQIRGAILFCGPYDMGEIAKVDQGFYRFFIKQLGWAYLGEKNWEDSELAKYSSTTQYVTSEFPATFLTDGNSGSFESHAKKLEKQLKSKNVRVESIFYPLDDGTIPHEFQFDFDNHSKEAFEVYDAVITFLSSINQ